MISVAAQPFPYDFPPDKVALLILDMQRDFIEHGGFGESLGNDVRRLQKVVKPAKLLLDLFRRQHWPVIYTREGHAPDLSDCPPAKRQRGSPTLRIGDVGTMGRILIRGEPGNAIIPALAPAAGEIVIDKPGKGAFYATPLSDELARREITHLVIAGVTTDAGVQTTLREANDRGYACLLIEDATETYFPEFKAATLAMIRSQGAIAGWTAPLAAFQAAVVAEVAA
jgi:nicotinamidase-related amidase